MADVSKIKLPDGTVLNLRDSRAADSSVVSNLSSTVTTLYDQVVALSEDNFVVAWDGNSTPDVSAIPAGVSVTYGGTTYVGTLSASASTRGTTYLVGESGSDTKTRYITSYDGESYSWIDYGTTDIDMTDYQRKDDEVWLTEAEFNALQVKDPSKTYNVYEEVTSI